MRKNCARRPIAFANARSYLEEHPDFELRKMLLSGSLAKGTALKSISDIDVGLLRLLRGRAAQSR